MRVLWLLVLSLGALPPSLHGQRLEFQASPMISEMKEDAPHVCERYFRKDTKGDSAYVVVLYKDAALILGPDTLGVSGEVWIPEGRLEVFSRLWVGAPRGWWALRDTDKGEKWMFLLYLSPTDSKAAQNCLQPFIRQPSIIRAGHPN